MPFAQLRSIVMWVSLRRVFMELRLDFDGESFKGVDWEGKRVRLGGVDWEGSIRGEID